MVTKRSQESQEVSDESKKLQDRMLAQSNASDRSIRKNGICREGWGLLSKHLIQAGVDSREEAHRAESTELG